MKRKVRAITVNGQKFAWWCSISQHETTVKLSPFEDKTSVLSIVFSDDGCADNVEKRKFEHRFVGIGESLYGQYNESVVLSWIKTGNPFVDGGMRQYNQSVLMSADDTEWCVKINEPKMAGLLLTYLIEQNYLFETKKRIVLNGYDLLSQMGYRIVEVKKGLYW